MTRGSDPPRVTSPIWGPPPPCKQALKLVKATQKLKKDAISPGIELGTSATEGSALNNSTTLGY